MKVSRKMDRVTVFQPPGAALPAQQAAPSAAGGGGRLVPGQILDGKYAIERLLGTGGAGSVYEATHLLLHRKVAVKVLHHPGGVDASHRERMLREGRHLASVVHPHIVQVFDLGLAGEVPYLVMEYLEGGTLEDHLLRTGRLSLPLACAVGHQMLLGLAAAHERGLVHRDLKPANVFLSFAGDGDVHVKILDFGVSTAMEADGRSDFVVGTPTYLAPEQARGETVDQRADVYGFAATMYEALTGQPVFSALTVPALLNKVCHEPPLPPAELRPDLPPALERMLLRALAKDPADRHPSARDLLAACDLAAMARGAAGQGYVLIAEADRAAAARCHAIASELGRFAVIARDGAEAIEMVSAMGPPEVALVNILLPGMDGFTLLRGVREAAPGAPVSAVVASPFRSLRDAAWGQQDELGIAYVLAGFTDEETVRAAMLAAFEGIPSMRRAARSTPAPSPDGPSTRRAGADPGLSSAPPGPLVRPAGSSRPPVISTSLPSLDDESTGTQPTLAELLRDPGLAVVVLNEDRRVVDLGGGAAALLGLPPSRARGMSREAFLQEISSRFEDPRDFLQRTAVLPAGPFVAYERFTLRGSPPRRISFCARPLATAQGIWHITTFRAE